MRKLVTILFLVLTINSFGQADSTSIYFKALYYYNAQLDSLKSKSTEIFVESNNGITDKFPVLIGNRIVTVLTWNNQKEIYKKNDNKIVHVKIFPAKIKDNIIEIRFVPYSGEYKGKRKGYFLSLGDWIIIQFKYDCEENTYKYYKTESGGI
jgi:hypothetical protein